MAGEDGELHETLREIIERLDALSEKTGDVRSDQELTPEHEATLEKARAYFEKSRVPTTPCIEVTPGMNEKIWLCLDNTGRRPHSFLYNLARRYPEYAEKLSPAIRAGLAAEHEATRMGTRIHGIY